MTKNDYRNTAKIAILPKRCNLLIYMRLFPSRKLFVYYFIDLLKDVDLTFPKLKRKKIKELNEISPAARRFN